MTFYQWRSFPMASTQIFLIDNGSLRPAATFRLRVLAASLSERLEYEVLPVSLLHSHKIPAEDLKGVPATIVRRAFKAGIGAGVRHIICVPLFLGPSLAITDYLQKLIKEARSLASDVRVSVADILCGTSVDEPDSRLIDMVADLVAQTVASMQWTCPRVALVDHGTPISIVNRLRNSVADALGQQMRGNVEKVVAASMERRDGVEYAFNEPLLESLTATRSRQLVVAMFFLLPGRHAGPEGDVAEICEKMIERNQFDAICQTPLLSEHPLLLDILVDRVQAVFAQSEQP